MALLIAENDPVFFINEFVWTMDPRENLTTIPFELFEKQEEAIRWIWDLEHRGKDGILEKSRDTGATWLTAAYAVHRWLFLPGAAIGFGSRKLELVDKIGDPGSIFEKIRIIIRNLPPWLLAAKAHGFNPKQHDNFCKIINPSNGANIVGEGGDDIGRGGRTTIYFIDEAAFLARPLLADAALSANSKCKVYVSTPHGSSNPFARKRFSGVYPVHTIHWKDDARKTAWIIVPQGWLAVLDQDQELILDDDDVLDYGLGEPPETLAKGTKLIYPWYEEVCGKYDPFTVAQEFDIDYTASLEGVVIPAKWLRACVGLQIPESAVGTSGFDVAAGGVDECVYLHRKGPVVKRIIRWHEDDPVQSAFRVVSFCEEDKTKKLFFDAVGVGSSVGGAIKLIRRPLGFSWHGVNVGTQPTDTVWADKMKSSEKFAKLKGEMWWRLRVRVEKTFQYVTQGIVHPTDELLSLPPGKDTEALISQLSNITYSEDEAGKIVIEKKKALKARGVASPDIAEALVLSFAPISLATTRKTLSGSVNKTTSTQAPYTLVNEKTVGGKRRRGMSA